MMRGASGSGKGVCREDGGDKEGSRSSTGRGNA